MNDINEFRKDYLNDVKSQAASNGKGTCATFVGKVADFLIDANVFSDFSEAFYSGTGIYNRKIRVDGYFYDDYDQMMNLIVAEYFGDDEAVTLTRTAAIQVFDRAQYFLDEALSNRLSQNIEISTAAADLVGYIRSLRKEIRSYRIYLITDGFMSDRITNIENSEIDGRIVERQIWDMDRIYKNYASNSDEPIEIDFMKFAGGVGLSCIKASDVDNDDYVSYLCIIPGSTLADIYDRCGRSKLLESNVRSFLSTKVAVNKKIRETILRCPQNFFAFNNGISATASSLEIETGPSGSFITSVKNFQIINGGQTTASLSNARYKDKADLSKIFVQMKLTIIEDISKERDTDLVREISKSSNSQNRVSDADFFSTHPFHIQMEKFSRRLYAPAVGGAQYDTKWYYERAKGQYLQEQMQMTKSEKASFARVNPPAQRFSKTDLAKVRNTWDGLPYKVSKGAQYNFMEFAKTVDDEWSKNPNVFNDKYFQESVALKIMFDNTDKLVRKQGWYLNAYKANIVSYSLALLHQLVLDQFPGYDVDLMQIWKIQNIPDEITKELIKITKYVFDVITSANNQTMNVTEWCKRKECWDVVAQSCKIDLSKDIFKCLISDVVKKEDERTAKKDQKNENKATTYVNVLSISCDLWKKIYDFASKKSLGTPIMKKALESVIYYLDAVNNHIPISTPPSMKQCELAMQLKELAESEGFTT